MARRAERLKVVVDQRRRIDGRDMRQSLFGRCRAAVDQLGDDISGFAIVVWDKNGDLRSAYDRNAGPHWPRVGAQPLFRTALNRHVAVKLG